MSSARVARWASRRSRCTRTPTPARRTSAKRTKRCAIGPAPSTESYLNIARVVDAARGARADAVHPGYGFLSENPAFADACESAGLVFVGPPAAVMRRMGSKTGARALMSAAGVPVVPGVTPASQSEPDITAAAETRRVSGPAQGRARRRRQGHAHGSLGGRVWRTRLARHDAKPSARSATDRSMSSGSSNGHVTSKCRFSADAHGGLVHLFERDCTLQRRHQKVIEEAPAPGADAGDPRRV